MKIGRQTLRSRGFLGISALALSVALFGGANSGFDNGLVGAAIAGSHSEGNQGGGTQTGDGNKGGGNQGGGDHGNDDHGDDHGDDHSDDNHSGDDSHDDQSEGHGKDKDGTNASRDGRPVWAKEGIPEIELGRLNVARSPKHVLDRAYDEALANFTTDMAAFYDLSLEDAIQALKTNFDNLSFIDSPLQNLALFKDALDGTSILNAMPGVSTPNDTLLALFLGTSSDKTMPISAETAYAVALILGTELTQAQSTALAADAEAVRVAILAGHG